jgi:hypothetical protein
MPNPSHPSTRTCWLSSCPCCRSIWCWRIAAEPPPPPPSVSAAVKVAAGLLSAHPPAEPPAAVPALPRFSPPGPTSSPPAPPSSSSCTCRPPKPQGCTQEVIRRGVDDIGFRVLFDHLTDLEAVEGREEEGSESYTHTHTLSLFLPLSHASPLPPQHTHTCLPHVSTSCISSSLAPASARGAGSTAWTSLGLVIGWLVPCLGVCLPLHHPSISLEPSVNHPARAAVLSCS